MRKVKRQSSNGDSEDETISRKRQWKQGNTQHRRVLESSSDDDDSPGDHDTRQQTKRMPSQVISEMLETTIKPRLDALDHSTTQIKQKISDSYLQTTKNTSTIVKNTSKVAKLVEENREELKKVFSAVDSGQETVKGKLDGIAKSSNDTYNKVLEKNERQAYIIAKLNADKDRLQAKLEQKEQVISDRGLGNGRVIPRMMSIESITQENLEKTDIIMQKHNELRAKYDEVNAKCDQVNTKCDEVNAKCDEVNAKCDEVNANLTAKCDEINTKLDTVLTILRTLVQ